MLNKPNVVHLKSVDSTNNYALKLAREGAAHGTVVWADEQTDGRGQFDRKWQSEPGKDLLASFIVRPKLKAKEAAQITLKAAELIRKELLEIYQLKASDLTIKAPNDILLRGSKVSGILTESSSKGEVLEYAVIGVGINLNSAPRSKVPDATSFYGELCKKVEIEAVLKRLCDSIIQNMV
ncbi:MAG: biotin--[acetyl-CoA-carboxylase] ligase [Candidatus Omnitrophica bacterium]|nr:biotin--[acetyl-CoA-carboxylase] ligase [Candidatus Omnitrophota bacterium]